MPFFITIVLDGVGIGSQADADTYGDVGANTLLHVIERQMPALPNLQQAGIGCLLNSPAIPCADEASASFGSMIEVSAGKDSTTGHWELGGIHLERPFPTYPDGFPSEVIEKFVSRTGYSSALGNKAASGTAIIDELGDQHVETGWPIVYTSADSVFQIAAHKDIIPLPKLYDLCEIVRSSICVGEHAVGRVIARPFVGSSGAYERVSSERRDFSFLPTTPPVQQLLQKQGVRTVSIGKVSDLFGGVGFDEKIKTASNADGIQAVLDVMSVPHSHPVFVWVNLVDFDQEFGHRNDPAGFADALEEFDRALPDLIASLPADGRMILTADHGNDPTFPGTDHTREHVPVLLYGGKPGRNLGRRSTFADHAATVLDYFNLPVSPVNGTSFL
ncbi:MAG: phosphopentomutase [Rhodothermales bacterium]|nr:phosphopentomutase [Rhodothermales bacterium]